MVMVCYSYQKYARVTIPDSRFTEVKLEVISKFTVFTFLRKLFNNVSVTNA